MVIWEKKHGTGLCKTLENGEKKGKKEGVKEGKFEMAKEMKDDGEPIKKL